MNKVIVKGNPPSDNHLYGHRAFGKRVIRYMTAKGKAYKKSFPESIKGHYTTLKGKCVIDIKVYFGDKRKRDIQGCLKALIDSLEGIFYENDNQIVKLIAEKFYDKENPRSEIKVYEVK